MVQSKYQYGTNPRKVQSDYDKKSDNFNTKKKPLKVVEDLPRHNIKVSKEERKKQIKMTFTVMALFLLLVIISCRNSQIDKKFTNIQEQKKQLATLQKENEQLKVSIENSQNLSNVEKVAREELGMQKLSNQQTIYITLPKRDYVEPAAEKVVVEEKKSWWEEIADKIFDF